MADLFRPTSETWCLHADSCSICGKHKRTRGVTPWLDGGLRPKRRGWYERLFRDGVFRHWWDGKQWRSHRDGGAHWRQVGDYPCWRGLTCTAFMNPSRYPLARESHACMLQGAKLDAAIDAAIAAT